MRVIGISIDKAKLEEFATYESKGGNTYYNLAVVVLDQENHLGQDVLVHDKQTKDERMAKAPKNYCGGGKTLFNKAYNK